VGRAIGKNEEEVAMAIMSQIRDRCNPEEEFRGSFWRGIALDIDTRLRVGRAIGKNEEEVAMAIMSQIRDRCNLKNLLR